MPHFKAPIFRLFKFTMRIICSLFHLRHNPLSHLQLTWHVPCQMKTDLHADIKVSLCKHGVHLLIWEEFLHVYTESDWDGLIKHLIKHCHEHLWQISSVAPCTTKPGHRFQAPNWELRNEGIAVYFMFRIYITDQPKMFRFSLFSFSTRRIYNEATLSLVWYKD